jgi:protein-L-isoaspartate(D-aspartate) O-methyltransferase
VEDTPKFRGLRQQLVAVLKEKGIADEKVLKAIGAVPRHWFMDKGLTAFAYEDKAYPIAADQTISQPYTVAFQTQLLELHPGAKVLEIGTGSGYQTAVLLHLGAIVYTVERQHALFKKTQRLFAEKGYRPKRLVFGDGYKGLPETAPYNAILVTAGAPSVPQPLLAQLAIGGHLVIPVGENEQIMTRFTRTSATTFDKKTFGTFRFVPLLEDKN